MPDSLDRAPLTVHDLTPADEPKWDAFVAACPTATFCHRAGWRRVIESSMGQVCRYRFARRGERIVGVLPLVEVRSALFGDALISTGFCVYGGIAATDRAAVDVLAADATMLGRRLGVDYIELRHRTPLLPDWVVRSELYAGFRRPLFDSDERNLAAIPRKKRADVRKSLNNGLNLVLEPDTAAFYAIYAESLRNLGTPVHPRRFFAAIRETFGADVEVSLVVGPDRPLAALMTFYFRDQVMPYFGGAVPEARALHAYDFLYWTLMCRATARGAREFDFGRSKRGTGAFAYKTFWGFEPEPLHYQFLPVRAQTLPEINPLNPKYRLLVAAWRHLPLVVANRLGPWISSNIG